MWRRLRSGTKTSARAAAPPATRSRSRAAVRRPSFPAGEYGQGHAGGNLPVDLPVQQDQVFFGAEIGTSVAQDGQHYVNLDSAFVYRKQLVANCTCNGKDAFGLAPLDVRTDPTLRLGDIVATKDGLASYTGRSGPSATFTPVNPATLPNDIR